jgi:predicted phage terminase large subunit-like protein
MAAVRAALEGKDIWWVAPAFHQGELGWKEIDYLCRQVNAGIGGVRFEGRPVYRITLPTGGTIQLRSADNPDSLRGATLDGVVFDEAAQAKPAAWPTLEPTLAIRDGWALFISTPRGLNWFHALYQEAAELDEWERWQLPSASSPFMRPTVLEAARKRQGSLYFSQEYGAEFISSGSGVFRADWVRHYFTRFDGDDRIYMLGEDSVPASACGTFHTVDLAWSQAEGADYTVISTWAVTPKRHILLLDVDRNHYEGPDIVPRLRHAYQKYGGYFAIEKATKQLGIIQEAERQGIPLRVVKADKDKEARALPASAAMESGRVWFPIASVPWYRDIEDEMLSFPAGKHDDFVDTLAYAVLEVGHRSPYEDRGLETF